MKQVGLYSLEVVAKKLNIPMAQLKELVKKFERKGDVFPCCESDTTLITASLLGRIEEACYGSRKVLDVEAVSEKDVHCMQDRYGGNAFLEAQTVSAKGIKNQLIRHFIN